MLDIKQTKVEAAHDNTSGNNNAFTSVEYDYGNGHIAPAADPPEGISATMNAIDVPGSKPRTPISTPSQQLATMTGHTTKLSMNNEDRPSNMNSGTDQYNVTTVQQPSVATTFIDTQRNLMKVESQHTQPPTPKHRKKAASLSVPPRSSSSKILPSLHIDSKAPSKSTSPKTLSKSSIGNLKSPVDNTNTNCSNNCPHTKFVNWLERRKRDNHVAPLNDTSVAASQGPEGSVNFIFDSPQHPIIIFEAAAPTPPASLIRSRSGSLHQQTLHDRGISIIMERKSLDEMRSTHMYNGGFKQETSTPRVPAMIPKSIFATLLKSKSVVAPTPLLDQNGIVVDDNKTPTLPPQASGIVIPKRKTSLNTTEADLVESMNREVTLTFPLPDIPLEYDCHRNNKNNNNNNNNNTNGSSSNTPPRTSQKKMSVTPNATDHLPLEEFTFPPPPSTQPPPILVPPPPPPPPPPTLLPPPSSSSLYNNAETTEQAQLVYPNRKSSLALARLTETEKQQLAPQPVPELAEQYRQPLSDESKNQDASNVDHHFHQHHQQIQHQFDTTSRRRKQSKDRDDESSFSLDASKLRNSLFLLRGESGERYVEE
jgi:hypothetical protein